MTPARTQVAPEAGLTDALAAFDEGTQILEQAYRELWAQRENERGAARLLAAERIRDLCHELKNPLGGVRGLAVLLRRELQAGAVSAKARRLLDRMEDGLDAMESVVGGQEDPEGESADAGMIAEETAGLALAEDRANGGNVMFRVEAPEGIELPLPAGRFREILSNLVRNGAQACDGEGTVTIRMDSGPGEVVAWVEDDGPGLPPVPDEILFRRGFSTKGFGRGRGLALTCELVEKTGGSIIFGRQDRGTRVRVRLPRR